MSDYPEIQSIRLCHLCMNRDDGQYYVGTIGDWAECSRCGAPSAPHVLTPEANEPHATGWGLRWCSTSKGLVVAQPFRWDVNGFYARLGVDPTATRTELREAYRRVQGEGADPRLSEALKYLLHGKQRWAYDRRPLGQPVNDEALYQAILTKSTQAVADAIRSGDEVPQWVQDLSADEPDETVLDPVTPARHSEPWPFSFFTWQSGNRNSVTMQRWQELLLLEMTGTEEVYRLSVGFSGRCMEQPWEVKVVDHLVVAFLSDTEEPTAEYAKACLAAIHQVRATGCAAHNNQERALHGSILHARG